MDGKTTTIDIEPTDTVKDMKMRIYLLTGMSHFHQCLYRFGLNNDANIVSHQLQEASSIQLDYRGMHGLLVLIDKNDYIDHIFGGYQLEERTAKHN